MHAAPPRVVPPAGRPSADRRALMALAAAGGLLLVLGLGLLLASRPGLPAPSPAALTARDASGVATGSPAPTQAAYDADGVPRSMDGEPVLRGPAIVERARAGDAASFLVAGWQTQDPVPSCAPGKYHCGYTSLVDGPFGQGAGLITLDQPAGTQFSFDSTAQWVGGFYILRVRPACGYYSGLCLVVDEEIPPPGALPAGPAGFDSDGLPRTVDGQPVMRGIDVVTKMPTAQYAGPLYVAGQVEPAPSDKWATCPDLVTWDAHSCPAIRLADPALGWSFAATTPTLIAARWGVQQAWNGAALWPGGYVVLRADARFVFGFVPPPGPTPEPTQAPMPSLMVSSGAFNARVIEVEQGRVLWGAGIRQQLAAHTTSTFLVTGAVGALPCGGCAGGSITVLREPRVRGAKDGGTAFPLLRSDGSAFVLGRAMVWTDPPGVVVLEVRPYAGACPPGMGCARALEVLRVAVTLP